MMNNLEESSYDDLLLKFFHDMIESENEKKILDMIFKNFDVEEIVEEMIGYNKTENSDAEI